MVTHHWARGIFELASLFGNRMPKSYFCGGVLAEMALVSTAGVLFLSEARPNNKSIKRDRFDECICFLLMVAR